MQSLSDFLLQRIAEDEAAAQESRPDEYLGDRDFRLYAMKIETGYSGVVALSGRVLAECEAKRRIVERCRQVPEQITPHYVLRILVAVYADHPDYSESWKP